MANGSETRARSRSDRSRVLQRPLLIAAVSPANLILAGFQGRHILRRLPVRGIFTQEGGRASMETEAMDCAAERSRFVVVPAYNEASVIGATRAPADRCRLFGRRRR